jgi:hypothetical protein
VYGRSIGGFSLGFSTLTIYYSLARGDISGLVLFASFIGYVGNGLGSLELGVSY